MAKCRRGKGKREDKDIAGWKKSKKKSSGDPTPADSSDMYGLTDTSSYEILGWRISLKKSVENTATWNFLFLFAYYTKYHFMILRKYF